MCYHGESTRIVLLGKTGAGKSSLANTILGNQNLFEVSHSSRSGTNICESKTKKIYDRNITLIDTPGVFDTDPRSSDLSPELLKCVQECAPGPHAFLLVLKAEKYTKQEQAVVDVILKYFSEKALKYTTVVFTHGDQIEKGDTIERWYKDNVALNDLVQKCGGRCHVFDNKYWNDSADPYRNNQFQIRELLNTIEQTVKKNRGRCYTNKFLKMVDEEIQQEMRHIQACSPQRIRFVDIVHEAKRRMYAKVMKNMEGAVVGVVLGAFLGAGSGVMVTILVTRSPDLLQRVAAAGTGAIVVAPTTGLAAAWASDRWSSPTEAVQDAREFLREVELLIRQGNQLLNAFGVR
ncbi:hypothetical protein WMY93_014637 [Mugilogobius chulae]|uniref:AIG1-type G domain-containing protein n=1 Tax=Mugilogobius chulae TaxID=88201 RepID=A0AAW0NZS6_9GOBI